MHVENRENHTRVTHPELVHQVPLLTSDDLLVVHRLKLILEGLNISGDFVWKILWSRNAECGFGGPSASASRAGHGGCCLQDT